MSEFPAFEASLLRAAHRRYGWRRWRPPIAVALVAAAAAGVMLLLVARPAPRADERPAAPRWEHHSVPRYGLDLSLPEGWRLAPRTLTPHLLDPHEILSASTFAPGAPVEGCAMLPAAALQRMRRTDALVTVQERGKGSPGFAPRPGRFGVASFTPVLVTCAGPAFAGSVGRADFSAGPRNLSALVALGADASPRVRDEAYAILDRISFDPGYVPWWRFAG
jgi:hypothetical protein